MEQLDGIKSKMQLEVPEKKEEQEKEKVPIKQLVVRNLIKPDEPTPLLKKYVKHNSLYTLKLDEELKVADSDGELRTEVDS